MHFEAAIARVSGIQVFLQNLHFYLQSPLLRVKDIKVILAELS
jgi:hypothetical protein